MKSLKGALGDGLVVDAVVPFVILISFPVPSFLVDVVVPSIVVGSDDVLAVDCVHIPKLIHQIRFVD